MFSNDLVDGISYALWANEVVKKKLNTNHFVLSPKTIFVYISIVCRLRWPFTVNLINNSYQFRKYTHRIIWEVFLGLRIRMPYLRVITFGTTIFVLIQNRRPICYFFRICRVCSWKARPNHVQVILLSFKLFCVQNETYLLNFFLNIFIIVGDVLVPIWDTYTRAYIPLDLTSNSSSFQVISVQNFWSALSWK